MATLDGFVRSGKVRYIGCSNFTAAHIVEAQWAAHRLGATGFVSLQRHYSLLAREIEAEILPTYAQQGIGAITYGPLASGMLAGRYRPGVAPEPGSRMDQWLSYDMPAAAQWVTTLTTKRNHAIAATVAQLADDLDTSSAAVAIASLTQRPGINAVILGPRNREQLNTNLTGLQTP